MYCLSTMATVANSASSDKSVSQNDAEPALSLASYGSTVNKATKQGDDDLNNLISELRLNTETLSEE